MFNKDIAEKAVIASLTISVWSARKADKTVLKEISELYKSEEEQGSFSKLLIAKSRLEAIKDAATSARKLHNDLTLPWVDGGGRLLPSKDFPEYSQKMQNYKDQFFEAVDTFISLYDDAKTEGTEKLGQIANEKDYPSRDAVKEKYSFEYTFFPVPDNGDFRVTLSPDFVDSLKHNFDNNQTERFNKAKKAVVDEVVSLASNAIIRLKNTDPTSWFKATTIDHIVNYRKDHAMIELLDDDALFDFLLELSELASTYSVQDLRGDDQLRLNVADAFMQILKKASKDINLITTPIEILENNPDIIPITADINQDLSQVVANMTNIIQPSTVVQTDNHQNSSDENTTDISTDIITGISADIVTNTSADADIDTNSIVDTDPTDLTNATIDIGDNDCTIDTNNFTGIPEGANVTIMNAFGLQIGEQPVVNEGSIHNDIEKSNSDIAVKDVIVPEDILNSLNSSSEDIDKVKTMLIETMNSPIIESMIIENVINQDNNEYKSIDEFKESFKESLKDIGVEKKKLTMQEIIEQENKFYEKINK